MFKRAQEKGLEDINARKRLRDLSCTDPYAVVRRGYTPQSGDVEYDAEATAARNGEITEDKIERLASDMDNFIAAVDDMPIPERYATVARFASDARYLLGTSGIDEFVLTLLNIGPRCGAGEAMRAFFAIRFWINLRDAFRRASDEFHAGVRAYNSGTSSPGIVDSLIRLAAASEGAVAAPVLEDDWDSRILELARNPLRLPVRWVTDPKAIPVHARFKRPTPEGVPVVDCDFPAFMPACTCSAERALECTGVGHSKLFGRWSLCFNDELARRPLNCGKLFAAAVLVRSDVVTHEAVMRHGAGAWSGSHTWFAAVCEDVSKTAGPWVVESAREHMRGGVNTDTCYHARNFAWYVAWTVLDDTGKVRMWVLFFPCADNAAVASNCPSYQICVVVYRSLKFVLQ